jgi:hypothetical protein
MADEPTEPPSTGAVDESTLVPVERDRRFVVRLVLLLVVGAIVATFLGAWVQRRAGACGHSLLRPGESVIPPPAPSR